MLPMPDQVAPKLLLSVPLGKYFSPAPMIDNGPLASFTPLNVPPLHVVVPLTASVPVPTRPPLLSVKSAPLAAASSVTVPPLATTASSPAPGTPLGFQFEAVNQSPDATFQLYVRACAVLAARIRSD